MVYCLYDAKCTMDRKFFKGPPPCTMSSLRRDESHGKLNLLCRATNENFDQYKFHLPCQRMSLKTSASGTSLTEATEMAWRELATPGIGAPFTNNSGEGEFQTEIFDILRLTHRQLIIDSASNERLSGRQMLEDLILTVYCVCNCNMQL